jgi:hypothetical protein
MTGHYVDRRLIKTGESRGGEGRGGGGGELPLFVGGGEAVKLTQPLIALE